MSVLSDTDIFLIQNSEELMIVEMSNDCLRSSSYLLRLNDLILVRDGDPTIIDSRCTDTRSLFKEIKIPDIGFILEPQVLYLGASLEKLRLGNGICGELSLLSCYARIGINLNFGSNFVAATFGEDEPSRVVFEIINLSRDRILIYPGVKFCHLRLHKQKSRSKLSYSGIYSAGENIVASNFGRKPAK